MKNRYHEIITIVLFCGFLFGMLLGYLLIPKAAFSENEKRYLTQAPVLSWQAVSSGAWGTEAEDYMADHIPGRDFFVGLNAYFDLVTGRQAGKDVWLAGDRLVEAPVKPDPDALMRKVKFIQQFAQKIRRDIDFMLIPSAGWAGAPEKYADEQIIRDTCAQVSAPVRALDVLRVFENRPELYYKTDHHWTSLGAYEAYAFYVSSLGEIPLAPDGFERHTYGGFRGSTYSRSALWLTPAETLELWQGSTDLTVTNSESDAVHQGVFYLERLEEADKYTVFLDGNHGLVRIHNPKKTGKLLVIRDSYANSLGCFLAESFGEVVLLDLRYYRSSVSGLIEEEDFDRILICYSIGNFVSDTNFSWLR